MQKSLAGQTNGRFWLLVIVGWSLGIHSAWADIQVPKIFSDGMMLQRQTETHLHGSADPGEALVVTIAGNGIDKTELKTVCNDQGQFSVKFPAPPVGGPYELAVLGKGSSILIRDILVGDIWLCSGQSNMEWPMEQAENGEAEVAAAINANVRLLTIEPMASPHPLQEFAAALTWSPAKPESLRRFSAVGFYFGESLQKELNVPIGLIHASWGGTLAEAWVSQDSLSRASDLKTLYDFGLTSGDNTNRQDRHGYLFNGMISPLQRFPIKGVIWYQGESNVGRGHQYAKLFPLLIQDWRNHFQSPGLPFLFAQIAPYRYQSQDPAALPELWDAQLNTLKSLPHTGMAATADLGNATDIHPIQKKPVGQRLAAWALAEVYGSRQLIPPPVAALEDEAKSPSDDEPTESTPAAAVDKQATAAASDRPSASPQGSRTLYSGPIFRSAEIQGSQVQVNFFAGEGLTTNDGQSPREFLLAGEDQIFHPAQAIIKDQTIVLTSPKVEHPVAARYSWNDSPKVNLVNAAGLPAIPFRTDSFPLLSADKQY